jgi:hypothetical protein
MEGELMRRIERLAMLAMVTPIAAACGGSSRATGSSAGGASTSTTSTGRSSTAASGGGGGTTTSTGGGSTAASGGAGGSGGTSASTTSSSTSSSSTQSSSASTSTGGGTDMLPPGIGWHTLEGTSLLGSGVCAPDVGQMGNTGCGAIVSAWGSAVYVPSRRWLVLAGGGHSDYFGNELYALKLDAYPGGGNGGQMIRLNDPTPNPSMSSPWGGSPCMNPTKLYDGRPDSNHPFNGVTYSPTRDAMIVALGSGSPCGFAMDQTWKVGLAGLPSLAYPGNTQWTRLATTGLVPGEEFGGSGDGLGDIAVYDAFTDKVYVHTQYELDSYDFTANEYTRLSDFNTDANAYINTHSSGAIDPKRHLFVIVGEGNAKVVDLTNPSAPHQVWNLGSACAAWLDTDSPGITYDPVADKMVGITGDSDVVYTLDTANKTCSSKTLGGTTVATPSPENGVFGRFAYSDYCDCFAYVADPQHDAYILRTR